MKAVALKSLCDQDWKTQLARKYPNVPEGAIVEITNDEFTNFYGTWCEIMWNNIYYYVSKADLSTNENDIQSALQRQQEIDEFAKNYIRGDLI